MHEQKRHSACDECRRRKLKCPGESPSCSRCNEEHITCNYSMRKTMGRPRKRQRGEDANDGAHNSDGSDSNDVSKGNGAGSWDFPTTDPAIAHDEGIRVQHQHNAGVRERQSRLGSSSDSATGSSHFDYTSFDSKSGASTMSGETLQDSLDSENLTPDQGYVTTHNANSDTCTCLSRMYLTAANMESTRNAGFPTALTALKAGIETARGILLCTRCGKDQLAACQNIMLMHSLLHTMAVGFDKLLRDTDVEARRAKAKSETKVLASGDRSAGSAHMHTGAIDCPGRFDLELEPEEWAAISKRVVRKSILGTGDQWQTLEALVDATEARQKAWHYSGFPMIPAGGLDALLPEKDWTCLRMINVVRTMIRDMPKS